MTLLWKSLPLALTAVFLPIAQGCHAATGPARPPQAPRLSAEVVRYCQALYIGPPVGRGTRRDRQIETLRVAALAHFKDRPQESVRTELEPYLRELRPGTFAFSAAAYVLAYYIHPYINKAPGVYGRWDRYLIWSTTLEEDLPPPAREAFPGLISRPLDHGEMVSRAMVRLYRKIPVQVILTRFFEREVPYEDETAYRKATLYLVLHDPTSLVAWGSYPRLVEALRDPRVPRTLRDRALALVKKVTHDRNKDAARMARTILKGVKTGITGGV